MNGNHQGDRREDVVRLSVDAYSAAAEAYAREHASKLADRADAFAGWLPTPARILDAGCGPGRDLARFIAHGHAPTGFELNPAFVAMARTIAPTTRGDLRDVASHFPASSFDGLWASASMVHLRPAEVVAVLGQFARLVRPHGRLFASLRTSGATGWLDEPDGRRWYTVWTATAFADAVATAGFDIEQVTPGAYVEVWATRRG